MRPDLSLSLSLTLARHFSRLLIAGAGAFVLTAIGSPALAVQCIQDDLRIWTDSIVPVPPSQMVRAHGPESRRGGPPADPNVGDSWLWYTWSLAGFPTPLEKMCTIRGEGEHVYIVVEDSQWETNVDQADIDAMVAAWDNTSVGNWPDKGIYQLNIENFGPVPDQLDDDPKIYVLYYDFDVNSDGFFWAFDMYPDGTQQFASNETEVLYMNSSDFDPGGDYLVAVQAHEFQHMIHWLADDNEASWVNEGCSELAMWLYGRPDNVVAFNTLPDNNLTTWNGNFADYVKTYLFFLYFYEQYGGQSTILDLVSQASNGIGGVELALDNAGYTESFADVVSDWFVANYIDDPSFGDGRFGYVGEDLPTFAAVTRSSYPVPLTNTSVNHWATDYVKMVSLTTPQLLGFDGGDTSVWSARVIKQLGGVPVSVEPIVLDGVDAGTVLLPAMDGSYDEAVLVAGNISTSGLMTYAYSTDDDVTGVEDDGAGDTAGSSGLFANGSFQLRLGGANPSAEVVGLELRNQEGAYVEVAVHSAAGRRVRSLFRGELAPGAHSLHWDGRDDTGATLASGSYFVHARSESGESATLRVVRLR